MSVSVPVHVCFLSVAVCFLHFLFVFHLRRIEHIISIISFPFIIWIMINTSSTYNISFMSSLHFLYNNTRVTCSSALSGHPSSSLFWSHGFPWNDQPQRWFVLNLPSSGTFGSCWQDLQRQRQRICCASRLADCRSCFFPLVNTNYKVRGRSKDFGVCSAQVLKETASLVNFLRPWQVMIIMWGVLWCMIWKLGITNEPSKLLIWIMKIIQHLLPLPAHSIAQVHVQLDSRGVSPFSLFHFIGTIMHVRCALHVVHTYVGKHGCGFQWMEASQNGLFIMDKPLEMDDN